KHCLQSITSKKFLIGYLLYHRFYEFISQKMSLADKVIKNTLYYILFQLVGFLIPLILTPFIISKIGEVQYGIYVLILGFIGIFGLFDLSISSSFIIFISRSHVNKDYLSLNKYFNTGFLFYIFFSLLIVSGGYFFSRQILSLLNIPPELFETSVYVFNIGLIIFFISSSFTIFASLLIALQKMYVTSVAGIFINIFNLIIIFVLLNYGYGLIGIVYAQLLIVVLTNLLNIFFAKSSVKELRFGFKYFGKDAVKEMTKFGTQMQISKLAGFVSEKYDEFLLAYFSVLNNVTYFNVANRISRAGRLIPYQLISQVAPVASELNAKQEKEKINDLFLRTTKYLTLVSVPVFIFIFIFSDLIITTWLGPGYEISSYILKILAVGQVINMTLSAPGNSVIPNLGYPKFQMYEGLINLGSNIILSYLLIKLYGILGAAIGNTASTLISSLYVFFVSVKFFKESNAGILTSNYIKPVIAGIVSGILVWLIFFVCDKYVFTSNGRITGLVYLLILGVIFLILNSVLILKSKYLTLKDKSLIAKVILKIIPRKPVANKTLLNSKENMFYNNELVSMYIVTYNRLDMLKQCINSLLPTLEEINYEIIIVDNASNDGTKEYLNELKGSNRKISIINPGKNIGVNAKSLGAEMSKGDFIIGIDDDVIMFPENWIEKMVYAYKNIPDMGYLSTDVVQDENTNGAKPPNNNYHKEYFNENNIVLEVGPSGGWCFMISRNVYKKIGKLRSLEGRIFYAEDGDYVNRIRNKGLKYGILSGLKVYHAAGEFYNKDYKQVFENKYIDYGKGEPSFYRIKAKIKMAFSFKRYLAKLNELASIES
ncbi:MAG: glycosyltransferase, partial [bacterium]